ncbi:hypothetical protein [Halobellus rarus]|uniref:Uncharacterized protein n=1 Tax=Halobellus rarus TaxID=1126237 RepID=A0ABD6CHE9_9EURY|nr:hypothetical protein [Halobellus rarus]
MSIPTIGSRGAPPRPTSRRTSERVSFARDDATTEDPTGTDAGDETGAAETDLPTDDLRAPETGLPTDDLRVAIVAAACTVG